MNENMDCHPDKTEASRANGKSRVRTLIVCALIIAMGIAGASYIKKTAPQAQKRPPERTVALVKTRPLFADTHQVTVAAMGSVVPAREITLKTRVPGEIQFIHPEFVEGGFIRAAEKQFYLYRVCYPQNHMDLLRKDWRLAPQTCCYQKEYQNILSLCAHGIHLQGSHSDCFLTLECE